MVGIVIVSHSALLAAGVRELAEQMVQGRVPIATAGGVDDPENPIGTDALAVQAAIEKVYSDDGVVVLMDLGSALMSAELALELLDPAQQTNVFLCAAPLVEGAMAAVVQASVGSTAQQVMAEAQSALAVKEGQLGLYAGVVEAPAGETPPTSLAPPPAEQAITLQIRNRQGLHARPAALFVTTANQFQAEISVHKGGKQANAKSINQVATLGARQGDEVTCVPAAPMRLPPWRPSRPWRRMILAKKRSPHCRRQRHRARPCRPAAITRGLGWPPRPAWPLARWRSTAPNCRG
jgi:phosphocarrier protein FPr